MTDRRWSAVAEDYVRILWKAEERGTGGVVTSDLAAALGVTTSTVSTNLRKLDGDGLIEHIPYHRIALTTLGRSVAVGVVRRHRVIETFLHDRLGYSWDEVDAEAEALEHSASELLIDRLEELLGFPTHDPHGDPIPGRDGAVGRVEGRPADSAPSGFVGAVVRVLDDEPDVLRWLSENQVALGTTVRVGVRRAGVGLIPIEVGLSGGGWRDLAMPESVAGLVWLDGRSSSDSNDGSSG